MRTHTLVPLMLSSGVGCSPGGAGLVSRRSSEEESFLTFVAGFVPCSPGGGHLGLDTWGSGARSQVAGPADRCPPMSCGAEARLRLLHRRSSQAAGGGRRLAVRTGGGPAGQSVSRHLPWQRPQASWRAARVRMRAGQCLPNHAVHCLFYVCPVVCLGVHRGGQGHGLLTEGHQSCPQLGTGLSSPEKMTQQSGEFLSCLNGLLTLTKPPGACDSPPT